MISTDFETSQLLACEHRDQLARDMQPTRRTRPERAPLLAARRALRQAPDDIRSLPRVMPSCIRQPQEVLR
jgi:hypothetical protein